MAKERCPYCKEKIRTDAVKCKYCGSDVSEYMSKMRAKRTKTFFILLAILFGLYLLSQFTEQDSKKQTTIPQKNNSTIENYFNKMTSAEHLAEAQKALDEWKPNKDPMKTSWGRVSDAKKHLMAIPQNALESAEKGKLLNEVLRREKEIEKAAQVVTRKIMIQQRKEFAKKYELSLLDKGMDTTITTLGKDHSTLKIKWVLMSRPLVYKFINDESVMVNLRNLGFKKLVFTDGYDNTWTSDLTK